MLDHRSPNPSTAQAGPEHLQGSSSGAVSAVQRKGADAAWLEARLVNGSGVGVAGAVVTCCPMLPEFLGPWVGWSRQVWPEIGKVTMTTQSDETGTFRFTSEPPTQMSLARALWITHPSYQPKLIRVPPSESNWSLTPTIQLELGAAMQVSVLDGGGAVVEGALISQYSGIACGPAADRTNPQEQRVLYREFRTGTAGITIVDSWIGPVVLQAQLGNLRSQPWVGEPKKHVELRLVQTFDAGGVVEFEAGSHFVGSPRIICSAEQGTQMYLLATGVTDGGRWKQRGIPLLESDSYCFRLEGYGAAVLEKRVGVPAPGANVRIDFLVKRGSEVWSVAKNEAGETIHEARMEVSWDSGDGRSSTTAYARDREDGNMAVEGVPAGPARLVVSAPGYVSKGYPTFQVPQDPPFIANLKLDRAVPVRGRVTFEGAPVEDFEVLYWLQGRATTAASQEFRGREDGTFELSDVPQGLVSFAATAFGRARSQELALTIGAESKAEVIHLELGRKLRGKGRIVDAASLDPIPSAHLQVYLSELGRALAPLGAPLQSDDRGEFDLVGFDPGKSRVHVWAQGYSSRWVEVLRDAEDEVDFGLIALSARQDLRVRLVSDGATDPTKYVLFAYRAQDLPDTRFDSNGLIHWPDVSAGIYTFDLSMETPTGWRNLYDTTVILESGKDWLVELPGTGSRRLKVQVEGEAPSGTSQRILAELPRPGGRKLNMVESVPVSGRVEFDCVMHGDFVVSLLAGNDDQIVGIQTGTIAPDSEDVEVRISRSTALRTLRVVNGNLKPVANASAFLRKPGEALLLTAGATNAAGECAFHGLEAGEYRTYISHSTLGYLLDYPITFSADALEVVEIEFDPKLAFEVRVVDGETPLPGVNCMLWSEEQEVYGLTHASSDSNGVAGWTYFGPGTAWIKVDQSGYWPAQDKIVAAPPGNPTSLQVRRVGNLTLEVRSKAGLLVAGQAVELRSIEFNADVSGWISAKSIVSASGGLVTDAGGVLKLQGLPRGEYRWSMAGVDGNESSGVVQVPPHVTAKVTLLAP